MVRTKISQLAPKYILTIMDDDVTALEKRKTEIWEAKKGDIVLKGFRKGHVPRDFAENTVGYDNLYEDLVREVVARGLRESGQKVVGVGQAFIDIFTKEQPIVVRVEVWIEPSVHVVDASGKKTFEGIEFEEPDVSVEETEVEAVIQRMRDAAAVTKTVERIAEKGDVVVIDFQGKMADGSAFKGNQAKDYQVIVGAGILLPEFESQLIGVSAGEVKDVNLTFPDTWPIKDLAGKKAIFTTTIKEVKERVLPEVNDDFAKQMGYENVVSARSKMHEGLLLNKKQQIQAQVEQQILLGLMRSVEIDPIPEIMIQQQINLLIQNMLEGAKMNLEEYLKKTKATKEDLIAQHQQAAITDIRARLILKAIAEHEGLIATPEEEEQALKIAQMTQFKDIDIETLRSQIDREALTTNIRVKKAMTLVHEKAVRKVKLDGGPTLQQ